jgi:hypothetical protein
MGNNDETAGKEAGVLIQENKHGDSEEESIATWQKWVHMDQHHFGGTQLIQLLRLQKLDEMFA